MTQDWSGEERRAIQLHVLEYVEKKIDMSTDKIEGVFSKHEKEELERYDAIREDILELSRKMDAFHASIQSAFPKDEDGNPDYLGHQHDHKVRSINAEQDREVLEYARKWVKHHRERSEDFHYIARAVLATIFATIFMWASAQIWGTVVKEIPIHTIERTH